MQDVMCDLLKIVNISHGTDDNNPEFSTLRICSLYGSSLLLTFTCVCEALMSYNCWPLCVRSESDLLAENVNTHKELCFTLSFSELTECLAVAQVWPDIDGAWRKCEGIWTSLTLHHDCQKCQFAVADLQKWQISFKPQFVCVCVCTCMSVCHAQESEVLWVGGVPLSSPSSVGFCSTVHEQLICAHWLVGNIF